MLILYNILYVSTFNKKLFEATGRNMLRSFAERKPDGDLLVCYEDDLQTQIKQISANIQRYSLDKDPFLKDWLKRNEDIIPYEYGGKFHGRWDNIKRKYGTDFNYQAARFFRKVVSLNYAKEFTRYRYIILIDCDTLFKRRITAELIENLFSDHEMIYMLGKQRERLGTGIEAGWIGFQKNTERFSAIDSFVDIYKTGEFRSQERWDDGFILRSLLTMYKCKDLVEGGIFRSGAETLDKTPLSSYFAHKKGLHQRAGVI